MTSILDIYVVLLKEEDNFFIFYKVYPLGYNLLHRGFGSLILAGSIFISINLKPHSLECGSNFRVLDFGLCQEQGS